MSTTVRAVKKARSSGHNIRHEKRRGFHATPALFFKGRPLPKFPIGIAVTPSPPCVKGGSEGGIVRVKGAVEHSEL